MFLFSRCLIIALTLVCAGMPVTLLAFDLQAHRGGRGLMPENTLPAFAHALSMGVTTLELDTNITADGAVLVGHDPVLQPGIARGPDGRFLTTPGPVIFQTPLSELLLYDVGRLNPDHRYGQSYPNQTPVDGTRMPELRAVFALAAKAGAMAIRYNIETKISPLKPTEAPDPEAFAARLIEEIRVHRMEQQVTLQSFDWRSLRAAQRLAPGIARAMLTIESPNFDTLERGKPGASPWLAGYDIDDYDGSTPRLVKAAGGTIWSPFWRNLTAQSVAEAQALGLQVIPWTVNDPGDMDRLIAMRVDGIITDFPDRLRQVLAARGLPLPPAHPVAP